MSQGALPQGYSSTRSASPDEALSSKPGTSSRQADLGRVASTQLDVRNSCGTARAVICVYYLYSGIKKCLLG